MNRPKAAGLVPLDQLTNSSGHTGRDVLMRSPRKGNEQRNDWFRIENKASVDTTEVYIYDEIGYWGTNAQDFVKQMMAIDTGKIDLHLNSPGGEVFDGVAIYNALKSHSAEVTVYVDSLAASAASFIAQAGDKVVMARNATMMIHDASGLAWGNAQDMRDTADLLDKLSNNIADIYAQRAGGTVETWRDFMREEIWYNAQEAVDAKLADSIGGEGAAAENSWDLTIFNHAGRSDAPSPDLLRERVTNRVKEARMSKATTPRNEGTDEQPPVEGAPAEEVTPEEEVVPAGNEPTEEAGVTGDGVPEPGSEPVPENKGIVNKASGVVFNLNGAPVTDQVAVQNHINSLEQFRKETLEAGRRQFVENLALANKIGEPQKAGLEEFALNLSPEQYVAWTATWDVAVTLPLLGKHAAGTSNHDGDADSVKAVADNRLRDLKDIIKQHKMSNMPVDAIKKTASFNELIKLDPSFTL